MTSTLSKETPSARTAIDLSLRLPVLVFFGTSLLWLLAGTGLTVLAAAKLSCPSLLDGLAFLNYGRVVPAAKNALVFGWASQAGIGAALWIMARLGSTPLRHDKLLISACLIWNAGLSLGILGILSGYNRSLELLELPGYASTILFVSYAFMGIWGIITFKDRTTGGVFISQVWILAALFCFPWLYATANLLLIWQPVQGSAQPALNAWYVGALSYYWLAPLALASAFYLIPKITGRPIFSNALSILAFWSFLLLGGWTGMSHLIGGPVPAWMATVGSTASFLMAIPVIAIAINLFKTAGDHPTPDASSDALRFTLTGVGALLLAAGISAFLALPSASGVFNFSDVVVAREQMFLLGFVTISLLGAISYITPRLVGWDWPSPCCMKPHFWLTTFGLGISFVSLVFGGFLQGFAMSDVAVTFKSSILFAAPFRALSALSLIAFFLGQVFFVVHFVKMLLHCEELPSNASSTKEAVHA